LARRPPLPLHHDLCTTFAVGGPGKPTAEWHRWCARSCTGWPPSAGRRNSSVVYYQHHPCRRRKFQLLWSNDPSGPAGASQRLLLADHSHDSASKLWRCGPALCLSRPGSADLHWWAQRVYHAEGCGFRHFNRALVLQTDVVMGLQIHRTLASTPRLGLTPTFGAVLAWPRLP